MKVMGGDFDPNLRDESEVLNEGFVGDGGLKEETFGSLPEKGLWGFEVEKNAEAGWGFVRDSLDRQGGLNGALRSDDGVKVRPFSVQEEGDVSRSELPSFAYGDAWLDREVIRSPEVKEEPVWPREDVDFRGGDEETRERRKQEGLKVGEEWKKFLEVAPVIFAEGFLERQRVGALARTVSAVWDVVMGEGQGKSIPERFSGRTRVLGDVIGAEDPKAKAEDILRGLDEYVKKEAAEGRRVVLPADRVAKVVPFLMGDGVFDVLFSPKEWGRKADGGLAFGDDRHRPLFDLPLASSILGNVARTGDGLTKSVGKKAGERRERERSLKINGGQELSAWDGGSRGKDDELKFYFEAKGPDTPESRLAREDYEAVSNYYFDNKLEDAYGINHIMMPGEKLRFPLKALRHDVHAVMNAKEYDAKEFIRLANLINRNNPAKNRAREAWHYSVKAFGARDRMTGLAQERHNIVMGRGTMTEEEVDKKARDVADEFVRNMEVVLADNKYEDGDGGYSISEFEFDMASSALDALLCLSVVGIGVVAVRHANETYSRTFYRALKNGKETFEAHRIASNASDAILAINLIPFSKVVKKAAPGMSNRMASLWGGAFKGAGEEVVYSATDYRIITDDATFSGLLNHLGNDWYSILENAVKTGAIDSFFEGFGSNGEGLSKSATMMVGVFGFQDAVDHTFFSVTKAMGREMLQGEINFFAGKVFDGRFKDTELTVRAGDLKEIYGDQAAKKARDFGFQGDFSQALGRDQLVRLNFGHVLLNEGFDSKTEEGKKLASAVYFNGNPYNGNDADLAAQDVLKIGVIDYELISDMLREDLRNGRVDEELREVYEEQADRFDREAKLIRSRVVDMDWDTEPERWDEYRGKRREELKGATGF